MSADGNVTVDEHGWIHYINTKMAPWDATRLAEDLMRACESSLHRNQIGKPSYYDSENILRRQNSKLGQAIFALSEVFK
jgi:hypothetical protein